MYELFFVSDETACRRIYEDIEEKFWIVKYNNICFLIHKEIKNNIEVLTFTDSDIYRSLASSGFRKGLALRLTYEQPEYILK